MNPTYKVNAFYDPRTNEYALLPGIIRYPFYDMNLPITVKYGGIGVVLGHEILHGFDRKGINILHIFNINYLIFCLYFNLHFSNKYE